VPVRKREGKWHYRFWIAGREYTGNTGLDATEQNRKRAEKLAEGKRHDIEAGHCRPEPRLKLFRSAAEEFISWCHDSEYRSRPNTARRIETSFASLIRFFEDRPVGTITAGDVEQYKAWRLSEHRVREITVRHDLDALSVFFRKFAVKFGWAVENPVSDVTRPSDRDAIRIHVLSPAEEAAYFNFASIRKPTLHDVARLIRLQGCRPEEIMALQQEDVDLETRSMRIRGGKSRAARRTLALVQESVEILRRRLGNPNRWVFPSPRYSGRPITKLNNQHDQVCREAGVSCGFFRNRSLILP